jgi:uncharacterized membrane protein YwzB
MFEIIAALLISNSVILLAIKWWALQNNIQQRQWQKLTRMVEVHNAQEQLQAESRGRMLSDEL